MDVLKCPKCHSRMRLVAMVTDPKSVARFLKSVGEHAAVPERAPNRGPPYWASTVLRQKAIGEAA